MYVTATAVLDRVALRTSAHTVAMTPRGCEVHVPYSGTLTPAHHTKLTCALRRNMIEMRYGMRLKGVTVTSGDGVLVVSATASKFAITHWLDTGEFLWAIESAVHAVVR